MFRGSVLSEITRTYAQYVFKSIRQPFLPIFAGALVLRTLKDKHLSHFCHIHLLCGVVYVLY